MLDLYYIFDPKAGLYLNLLGDPNTKVKEWIKWNEDALEIPLGSAMYGFGFFCKTRFTMQEVFELEDKYNVQLIGYIELFHEGDDKHLQI